MKRAIMVVFVLMLLAGAGYLIYNFVLEKDNDGAESKREEAGDAQQQKIAELEDTVSILQEALQAQEEQPVPREKITEVFGDEKTAAPALPERPVSCEELERRITSFFSYLNDKGYVRSGGLAESPREYFDRTVELLAKSAPQITGEMQEMPILIKNLAHFYRTLGKRRMNIARAIITNETDILEPALKTFYEYFSTRDRCRNGAVNLPSLETLYDYSVFFLNTLAGKSYLLRRDSKIRILARYYCTLVIDEANRAQLNRYGFDIRPQIELLRKDINDHRGLIYKKVYLDALEGLRSRYP